MKVRLHPQKKQLQIKQKIVLFNTSKKAINKVYLHNWANAYKDKNTPLAKRFTDNFSRDFHFTSDSKRGFSQIHALEVNGKKATWVDMEKHPDIVAVFLEDMLLPSESVVVDVVYTVKIPHSKFTGYGVNNHNFNLKYWYLLPAVIPKEVPQEKTLMSNLDMGDLYSNFTHYYMLWEIPKNYTLISDLKKEVKEVEDEKICILTGYKQPNVAVSILPKNTFKTYAFKEVEVITDMDSKKIPNIEKRKILQRQLQFLNSYFGKYPHKKIMLREVDYKKNPIYGLNQLPSFLNLFDKKMDWDLKVFKLLSQKYIDAIFMFNKRVDYGVTDGVPTYISMQYINQFYPKASFVGKASKWPVLKTYEIAKMNFADRYYYFYNLAAQYHYLQPFSVPLDSLSNFNRKIVSKYKSAVYINLLDKNLNGSSFKKSIRHFSKKYFQTTTTGKLLFKELQSQAGENLLWFENDFLKREKEIDYSFKKIKKRNDSIDLQIDFGVKASTPFLVFGMKKDSAIYQKKIVPKGEIKTISTTIPNYNFDKLVINKNHTVPESNAQNNWKNINGFFKKPIKMRFLKDIENPKYHQLFYNVKAKYNYYDGVILGVSLTNKILSPKKFIYKIFPSYGFKSKTLSGTYLFSYRKFSKIKAIRRYAFGVFGSNYQYAPNLRYNAVIPYVSVSFNQKDLRYPEYKSLTARYTSIQREKPLRAENNKVYDYGVFSVNYNYFKPGILKELKFGTELQIASNFSKVSMTYRYKRLTDKNRQITLRFFTGAFLKNKTKTNFFSFALERPTDYLFQYNYLGRSETSGLLSQQIVISEGGFTSKLPAPFANSWIATTNAGVSIWRWFEVYGNVGIVKNRNQKGYFAHECGFKFNFIPDMFEVYFPMNSNLGWEVGQSKYTSKIRFVIEGDLKSIYNFIRRGFY